MALAIALLIGTSLLNHQQQASASNGYDEAQYDEQNWNDWVI